MQPLRGALLERKYGERVQSIATICMLLPLFTLIGKPRKTCAEYADTLCLNLPYFCNNVIVNQGFQVNFVRWFKVIMLKSISPVLQA